MQQWRMRIKIYAPAHSPSLCRLLCCFLLDLAVLPMPLLFGFFFEHELPVACHAKSVLF
jgi:hypothetical protein